MAYRENETPPWIVLSCVIGTIWVLFLVYKIAQSHKQDNSNKTQDYQTVYNEPRALTFDDPGPYTPTREPHPNDLREDPKIRKQRDNHVITLSDTTRLFEWSYDNHKFQLTLKLSPELASVYSLFEQDNSNFDTYLKMESTDTTIQAITRQLREIAVANDFTEDQLVELAIAFVQSIPYDFPRATNAEGNKSIDYLTPYEVLFFNRGICLDKSILGIAILRELEYGCALLLYNRPINWERDQTGHAAIGIQSTGVGTYPGIDLKYIESTSKLPIGIVPVMSPEGILSSETLGTDPSSLGPVQIKMQSSGRSYRGRPRV